MPNENQKKPAPAVVQKPAPAVVSAAPGIFDELRKHDEATTKQGEQVHAFGAWCRSKGVKLEKVREAIKAGRVSGDLSGDGPEMTEAEFESAVQFEYRNSFGHIPHVKHHVPAELARQGGTSDAPAGKEGDPLQPVGGDPTRTV